MVNHRIHVAGGNAEKQVRLAERLERLCRLPIGLGDHAHPETLRFQHSAYHRHAKTGVINVAVPGDDNDVATVPSQLLHLVP